MNLFLVTSPFQYICAQEAKAHYNTKNNILLLVNQSQEPGLSQQKKLVNQNEWDHIIELERDNRTLNVPLAIRKVKRIVKENSLQHFFHAEYMGWRTKLLLKNLNISKEVLFDDGTLTINEYEEAIRPNTEFYRPRFLQDFVIRLLGCKPIGRLPQSKQLELFTLFDIENPEHNIVQNKLNQLQSTHGNPKLYNPNAPIGFIGHGSVGHKNQKSVNEYVQEISSFVSDEQTKVIYFPHRVESDEVKEKLSKLPFLTYHHSEYPLEIELINKNIELSALVGMCSTVLFTAHILYPNMPIYNLKGSLHGYGIKVQERVKRITHYLHRLGISEPKSPNNSD